MRKSKKIAAAAMAAVMMCSLWGCGNSGGGAGTETTSGGGAAAETTTAKAEEGGSGSKTKLTMAVWNGNWAEKLEQAQNTFNSQNPDIELDIQMQTGDYSDFLGAKVASDDLPDIYILTPYKQVQAFAEAGRLKDLSNEPFVDKVYENGLYACTYYGKVYGYPANFEYLGVFYNKDLFKQAGIESVPTTREEFEACCEKLQAAGINPIAPTYKDSWTLKHLFSALLTPEVQDDIPGFISKLDSGEGSFDVEGIDEVFAFADIMRKYSGGNMMDQDSTSGFNALANGQAAMLLSGEFSQATVAAMDNPPDIGCFAIPASSEAAKNKLGVDVGIVNVVNEQTSDFGACQKVLEFLSNADDPEGYIAITTARMGDAPPAMPYEGGVACSSSDDYKAYADAGNIVPWVYQQYVNGFDVISGDIFQGYMAGAKDKDTVIKELNENYKNFLEQ